MFLNVHHNAGIAKRFFCFVEVNASNHLTVYWHVYRSLMWVNGHIDMQVNKYVDLVLN